MPSSNTVAGRLNLLREKIKAFETLQIKHEDFGAFDTEPSGVFQVQLARAASGKSVNVPKGRQGWQLYKKRGVAFVAKQLHFYCQEIVDLIELAPNKERDAIREYLKDYCWRVTWDD